MKIGITADLHLKAEHECPERYNAVIDVLNQCCEFGIEHLVIAGDLFDQTLQNYDEFEIICKNKKFSNIIYHLIPGNHDPDIRQEHFAAGNILIYSEATWVDFDAGWCFLFIPYVQNKSMGEAIQEQIDGKTGNKWVLVGHGDWYSGMSLPNPYEPGVYMPITRKDIITYKPNYAILGHIHVPLDAGKLFHPGSPCGLDITETGYRRFLILDTETDRIESHRIHTDIIYLIDELIVLPTDDETQFVRNAIHNSVKSWGLDDADHKRVRLRVRCKGYSSNKAQLFETIKDSYKLFIFESDPDISEVFIANGPERNYLMDKVRVKLEALDWDEGPNVPNKNEILLQAIHVVYGEK